TATRERRERSSRRMTVYYQVLPGHSVRGGFSFRNMGNIGTAVFSCAVIALLFAYAWGMFPRSGAPFATTAETYDRIIAAQNAFLGLHFSEAVFSFHDAYRAAGDARRSSSFSHAVPSLLSFIPFLELGEENNASKFDRIFSEAAQSAIDAADPLFKLSQASLLAHVGTDKRVPAVGALLAESLARMKEAKEKLASARDALERVSQGDMTQEERDRLSIIGPRLSLVAANTDFLISRFELASWALGVDRPRRFLVAVQDVSVPRATGGLIGSYGVIETAGGAIVKVAFDDVYNLDGELLVNTVPPEPLQKVTTVWAFRNANWFLDFPLSAQKIAYFYAQAGGKDIDGVIAVDEKMFKRLLDITGPISVPRNEGVIVSSFNVGELMAARTEIDFSPKTSGDPSKALEDVVFALAGELEHMPQERVAAALSVMATSFKEKNIMLWTKDQARQSMVEQNGWDGRIAKDEGADYLAVTLSDIGAVRGESGADAPRILKETHITKEDEIVNTVVIEFKNREAKEDGGPSRYVRVYVPEGSKLLEASGNISGGVVGQIDYAKEGFRVDDDLALARATLRADEASHTDIFKESGKTVFGGWIPEKDARIIYTYTLPFRAERDLSFVFQKQPGVNAFLHFTLVPPEGKEVISDVQGSVSTEFSGDLAADKSFIVSIK
ncbi:DUF4012 domain-containing protein, partial [Candidatus Azambacteria bacterium]|nr:DUF4012 domain-containing protein [Candidatus Azambacteria bacterium]